MMEANNSLSKQNCLRTIMIMSVINYRKLFETNAMAEGGSSFAVQMSGGAFCIELFVLNCK